MSIPMQGSWTVSVKSREAGSTPQQFIISGADTGNGTYAGDVATPAVPVTGDAWSITVQHNPGTGFVDSFDQIVFPTRSGGNYRFDIQANDDSVDLVVDDLILTCSTPVTFTDFVVFGHVSWYSGCAYNPCNPLPYLAIESQAALADALLHPAISASITALYPERVFRGPIPIPDPAPFRPLLLPVEGRSLMPAKQVQVFDRAPSGVQAPATGAAPLAPAISRRILTASQPAAVSASNAISASALTGIQQSIQACQTGPLPQYLLRFQEYDRSANELAGGPYTGTGPRRSLGTTATDRRGNYIFRFHMTVSDYLDEIFNDTAPGEDIFVQALPDVIVQVLDASAPSGVVYETTPFFNIPFFKRIDVCVPYDVVHIGRGCIDGQIIQSIGNITVGPLVAGVRNTANTSLDANGVITSSSSLGPAVECSAWGGGLFFYACLSDPAVRYYTISFKRPADPESTFYANFVQEDYSPYHKAPAPIYWVQLSVGPTTRVLQVDGVFRSVPSYLNIETQPPADWMDRWKLVKMVLSSPHYQQVMGGAGPVMFRIQGYRADGTAVLGADDRITLYIDNNGVDQFIDPNLRMITTGGPIDQGDCALFTLPADQLDAPIEIGFRSNQNEGFMSSYQLYMYKGAAHPFDIRSVGPGSAPFPKITDSYRHGFIANCSFHGTSDDPHYGSPTAGELKPQVGPLAGTNWLSNTEVFCAFSINLTSSVRVTDGQSTFGPYYSGPILIGIKKP